MLKMTALYVHDHPYENGWTITVNGKKVTAEKSLLTALYLSLWSRVINKITMKFSPDYWKVSLIITGSVLPCWCLYSLFENKRG